MIHLLWTIPLFLFFWALVHGGTRKRIPPVNNQNNPDHPAGV